MSIIQRADEDELNDATDAQLFAQLGLNDTGALYQRGYEVDTDHDIPTGAGNSIDRKTVYIDRTLYDEVMDGGFGATGLEPRQIIRLWCDHEHTGEGASRRRQWGRFLSPVPCSRVAAGAPRRVAHPGARQGQELRGRDLARP